jgi:hypothetical protein
VSPFLSQKKVFAAQTTTVRTVKADGGVLTGWMIYNPNSSAAYVQLFDVAGGATVTLGTTVPDLVLGLGATTTVHVLDGTGISFQNGIKLACTTTATGSSAPSTGVELSVTYQ